jgi:hypothetical protein
MSEPPRVGAFAIVPSNDLPAAIPFWDRLGFARTGGDANYIIMTGWGCEVHLTQAGTGPWRVPEENNPFGVFIRTPDVAAVAARADDLMSRRRPAPSRVGSLRGRDMRTGRSSCPRSARSSTKQDESFNSTFLHPV